MRTKSFLVYADIYLLRIYLCAKVAAHSRHKDLLVGANLKRTAFGHTVAKLFKSVYARGTKQNR